MIRKRTQTILFVCTGNLCRSPMAEGILRDRIEKEGLEVFRVASAGTWGLEGEPAARHAIHVCSDRGIDLPIRDPYGRPKQAYVVCFEELAGYVDALLAQLREELAISH